MKRLSILLFLTELEGRAYYASPAWIRPRSRDDMQFMLKDGRGIVGLYMPEKLFLVYYDSLSESRWNPDLAFNEKIRGNLLHVNHGTGILEKSLKALAAEAEKGFTVVCEGGSLIEDQDQSPALKNEPDSDAKFGEIGAEPAGEAPRKPDTEDFPGGGQSSSAH